MNIFTEILNKALTKAMRFTNYLKATRFYDINTEEVSYTSDGCVSTTRVERLGKSSKVVTSKSYINAKRRKVN